MIKDSQEYQITKNWVTKFEEASLKVKESSERQLKDPEGWQLMQDSYNVQKQNLLNEIREYEALLAHDLSQPVEFELEDMKYFSDLLIKARIALKITQKELAFLSNHTEEQIIRFEEKNYHNASYVSFLKVQSALGFKNKNGKFTAQLNDFYQKELNSLRSQEHLDIYVHKAS
ncbi:hypothetical protein NIES4071_78830 [Calothrix sp. NIES-4071]|nr:hypothetical protein NIES4071_78830 [Calothrix sp. NIES-4071]BAZ62155.1 hypothetical protein NIES4105_78760 [Calothrix sp. NIES-4105]